jgi:hypothetical protein
MNRDKKLQGPIEITFTPGAPLEIYERVLKAVQYATSRGHTVHVEASPYVPPGGHQARVPMQEMIRDDERHPELRRDQERSRATQAT